ncbi:hypothetical protein DSM112329_05234 [Paraconexibacter sp. AEG42_29]|uniref:Fibronectin type-III domain-containing protein n=1 Tax=Paraconexibacter sp. AEG42_29 TaxID=2997339 RepID=A0AAU7B335_9ACTN
MDTTHQAAATSSTARPRARRRGGARRALLTAAAVLTAAAALPAPAGAFTLDKSLAGSGIDRIPVGDRDIAGAAGVAVMPDGRTVVTGYAKQGDNTLGAVLRVLPSGEPDPTFAAASSFPGTIFLNAAPGEAGKATLLQDGVLAPDGSIYVAGRIAERVGEYEESGQAIVAHVLPDGTVDPAFGTGGVAIIAGSTAQQVLIGPDGSLFVLSVLEQPGVAAPQTGIVKLTPGGTRDASYGVDGLARIQAGENYFTAAKMVQDPQGRVVLAGSVLFSSSVAGGVARVTAAGALDPGFGGPTVPGIATAPAPAVDDGTSSSTIDGLSPVTQQLRAVAIAPDGTIIVAGTGTTRGANIALVGRFTDSGKLDAAFGQKGFARFRGQQQPDRRDHNYDTILNSVAVDGGRIIVSGTQDSVEDSIQIKQPVQGSQFTSRTTPDLLVAGLTSAGRLDPGAHSGGPVPGVAVYPAGAQRYSVPRRMVIAGGSIVIAGRAKQVSSQSDNDPAPFASDFLLVRLGMGTVTPGPAQPPPVTPDPGCSDDTVKIRSVTLTGCATKKGGVFTYPSGTVLMNGTRIALLSGTRLVANPALGTIRTQTAAGGPGTARVSVATPGGAVVQLSKGKVDFTVPKGGGARVATLRDGDACKPVGAAIGTIPTQGVGNLLGFPLPGDARVSTANGTTYIQVNVSLPKPAFVNATGCATLVTTTGGGLRLDSLKVDVGTAQLGPLQFARIAIAYTGTSDTWKGRLTLTLPLPREVELTGEITFVSGDFGAALIGIEFPTAIPILPPSIGLKGVNAGIQIKPFTAITGGVHLTAGPTFLGSAAIDADLQGTISFPGKPYAIAVDITGKVRVVSIPVASASVHYDTGGTFFLKGNASFNAFVADVSVDVQGGVQGKHFFLQGDARACVLSVCAGSSALISEVGAAACGGLVTPVVDLAIGVAIRWKNSPFIPDELFFHCDLSSYQTFKTTRLAPAPIWRTDAFTRQASTAQSFTVPPGTKVLELKVSGNQTPLISVVGPGGERVDGPTQSYEGRIRAEQIAGGPAGSILSSRTLKASYVQLRRPAAGVWRVESQLGTAPITRIQKSVDFPQPKVTARVSGKGRSRVVAFKRELRAGETVTLVERAKSLQHPIGDLRAGVKAGSVRFTPGEGRGGRRQIVALVSQDGLPRRSVVLTSYVAPASLKPGRPRGVTLRVSGAGAVRASWKAVPRASRYVVTFRLKDGHATTRIVKATARPFVRVAAFLPRKGGRVTVVAVGRTALTGPSTVATLRPATAAKTKKKKA